MSKVPYSKQSFSQTNRTWRSRQRWMWVLAGGITLVLVVLGAVAVAVRGQSDDSGASNDVAANTTVTPLATMVPPTEPPREVSIQTQLADWLMTVSGVEDVLSLDIDTSTDEPPLIYAELTVSPGFNNSGIPAEFAARVNDVLLTRQYSDFVIIMGDGQQIVEYALNFQTSTWDETVLSVVSPVAAQSS